MESSLSRACAVDGGIFLLNTHFFLSSPVAIFECTVPCSPPKCVCAVGWVEVAFPRIKISLSRNAGGWEGEEKGGRLTRIAISKTGEVHSISPAGIDHHNSVPASAASRHAGLQWSFVLVLSFFLFSFSSPKSAERCLGCITPGGISTTRIIAVL